MKHLSKVIDTGRPKALDAFNPIIHDVEYKEKWEVKINKRNTYHKEVWEKQKAGKYKQSRL